MGYCKKDVTPLLMRWSYIFPALTCGYDANRSSEDVLNFLPDELRDELKAFFCIINFKYWQYVYHDQIIYKGPLLLTDIN